MEKQFVLNEKEFLHLCNQLERLGVEIAQLNRKLDDEDKHRLKDDFISIDGKLNGMKKDLGWM